MEQTLYEKIGKQEMIIEALRVQLNDLSGLVTKFISGEENPTDWMITDKGLLARKSQPPKSGKNKPEK